MVQHSQPWTGVSALQEAQAGRLCVQYTRHGAGAGICGTSMACKALAQFSRLVLAAQFLLDTRERRLGKGPLGLDVNLAE